MAGMYSERLVVRNFGPITNLDIEIRPLTLFIGTQGSGKSTVAKLLTICRNMVVSPKEAEQHDTIFRDYGLSDYFEAESYFSYTIGGYMVTYENGEFSFPQDELQGAKQILYVSAERNLVGSMSEAVASMWSAKIPISSLLLNCMSQFERAAKLFPQYAIPFFGVDYVRQDHRNMIELKGKNKYLPLSVSSSGLQSAIPMLMIVDYALKSGDRDAIVIEEPEQNLFPENQREVLKFVASRLSEGENRQFVLTTHSPYMLSCLNVLMLAHKLYKNDSAKDEVEKIVPAWNMVNPDAVAVYSLEPDSEDGIYCKSLTDDTTGLVSVNELDSVSLFIGEDFDRLCQIQLKLMNNGK